MDEGALYARAAEGAALSSDGVEAIRLVRAAIEKVDPSTDRYRAALLRERLGRYVWLSSGDTEAAEAAYRDAVELLRADEPRPELARVLAALGQILMLRGRNAESVARCEQAIAVARRAGARGRARAPRLAAAAVSGSGNALLQAGPAGRSGPTHGGRARAGAGAGQGRTVRGTGSRRGAARTGGRGRAAPRRSG
jgi:tetratricopeptide (TPR) repeat protein